MNRLPRLCLAFGLIVGFQALLSPAWSQDVPAFSLNDAAEPEAGNEAAAEASLPTGSAQEQIERFQLFPPDEQKNAKGSAAGRFLADIWIDQKAIWTAPARMDRRQMFTIALPLAAATACLIATDHRTSRVLPNSPGQLDWSQGLSEFGAIYTLAMVTGGPLIGGRIIHKPEYSRAGRNALEALANAVITSYALKAIAGRERPNEGDGNGRAFFSGGQSFPSGHTMNSWAVAAAIARTPNCPKWFAITSYVMATAISASRWSAHRHFPSDILVGGVFGALIGNHVATRRR